MSTDTNDTDDGESLDISDTLMAENERLADGNLSTMTLYGGVGFHIFVASDLDTPSAWWKVALHQAFDETLDMSAMVHVSDDATVAEAREEIERGLREMGLGHFEAEYLADEFESNLSGLTGGTDA